MAAIGLHEEIGFHATTVTIAIVKAIAVPQEEAIEIRIRKDIQLACRASTTGDIPTKVHDILQTSTQINKATGQRGTRSTVTA